MLTRDSGCCCAAVGAAGLGNTGLKLAGDQPYELRFLASSSAPVTLVVRLEDYQGGSAGGGPLVLAEEVVAFPGGNGTVLNFTLTPRNGTTCRAITRSAQGTDVAPCFGTDGRQWDAHACMECGGQLTVGLASAGDVELTAFHLQPGLWGRLNGQSSDGLPVLAESAAALQAMGTKTFRIGGTFAIGQFYFWKHFRGPVWDRPPASWRQSILTGWGPFEALDMCQALNCTFVYTTSAYDTSLKAGEPQPATDEAMADLVEYCYGNTSTAWGRRRIEEDGHPEPYPLGFIELGNEQDNPNWVSQAAAMQTRAEELGVGEALHFLYPGPFVEAAEPHGNAPNATAVAEAAALQLGDRLVIDVHSNAHKGTFALGADQLRGALGNPDYNRPGAAWGGVNCETNFGAR